MKTKGRIKRRLKVDRSFTESSYKKSKKYLLQDFEGRCAYSMQHHEHVGLKVMEVDHYNCTLRGRERHDYSNLYLSTRHCNGSKGAKWRMKDEHGREVRLLDPCNEEDYGATIFENPKTHELEGTNPSARWHIRVCDLNAPHLILERRDRAAFEEIKKSAPPTALSTIFATDPANVSAVFVRFEKMIPPIPPPP